MTENAVAVKRDKDRFRSAERRSALLREFGPALAAAVAAILVLATVFLIDRSEKRSWQAAAIEARLALTSEGVKTALLQPWEVVTPLAAWAAAETPVTAAEFDRFAISLAGNRSGLQALLILNEDTVVQSWTSANLARSAPDWLTEPSRWLPSSVETITQSKAEIRVFPAGEENGTLLLMYQASPADKKSAGGDDVPHPLIAAAVIDVGAVIHGYRASLADDRFVQSLRMIQPTKAPSIALDGYADSSPAEVDWAHHVTFSLNRTLWEVTAAPRSGWSPAPPGRSLFWAFGALVALVIAGLVFIVVRHPQRVDQSVARAISRHEEFERHFRAICDNSPTEIYLKDTTGRLVLVNKKVNDTFGANEETFVGKLEKDVFPYDNTHELAAHDDAVMLSGQAISNEYRISVPGAVKTQLSLRFPIRDQSGKITTIGVINTDITERKEAEEEFRASKIEAERAAQSKSRFVASASHDLRQPLAALKLMMYDLSQTTNAEDRRAILNTMNLSADAMAGLVNSLLDATKLEIGGVAIEFDDFRIADLLDEIEREFAPLARERGLELRVVPCSLTIQSDYDLLARIAKNFVSNAIRYTDHGRVLVGCRRHKLSLSLQVWDSGPGIDHEEQKNIFDEFYQIASRKAAHSSGLGLGLSIASHASRLLEAEIEVRSTPNKGSMFAVEMPLGDEFLGQAAPFELAMATQQQSFDGTYIFVLDDDDNIRVSMARLLQRWGAMVIAESNFGDAILALGKEDIIPDVLVVDYSLSEEKTGTDFIRTVRTQFDKAIPAVLITGEADLVAKADPKKDLYATLPKPVEPSKLRALLHHLIKKGDVGA